MRKQGSLSELNWKLKPYPSDYVLFPDEELCAIAEGFTGNEMQDLLDNPNKFGIEIPAAITNTIISKIKSYPCFTLIRCDSSLPDETLRCIYALYSKAIGSLNDRYGYFFDVVDQGLDYTKEAIPVSKTKASTGYHTDSTAKEYLPDIVGLLCLHPAEVGGDSLLTNAADLYSFLMKEEPAAVAEMEKPIKRDVITPGTVNNIEAITSNTFPIFSFPEEGFTFRYMRYWIETAFLKTEEEIPQELLKGLDATDHFFSVPENNVQFRMKRGDILFANNRILCHNRTAFENDAHSSKRTMVRAWINFDVETNKSASILNKDNLKQ